MSLATAISSAVATAFDVLGDGLLEAVTYRRIDDVQRDPRAGLVLPAATDASLAVLLCAYSQYDTEGGDGPRVGDQRCIIETARLGATPRIGDWVIRADGSQWQVINVKAVPGGSIWDLQLRQP